MPLSFDIVVKLCTRYYELCPALPTKTERLELAPAIRLSNHTVFRNLSEMGVSGVSSSNMPS
jgi:hypothetical protein